MGNYDFLNIFPTTTFVSVDGVLPRDSISSVSTIVCCTFLGKLSKSKGILWLTLWIAMRREDEERLAGHTKRIFITGNSYTGQYCLVLGNVFTRPPQIIWKDIRIWGGSSNRSC